MSDELARIRARIDEVDLRLVRLLAERATLVDEAWRWKAAHDVPRVDPAREAELRARLLDEAEALGLSRAAVDAVLARVVGQPLR